MFFYLKITTRKPHHQSILSTSFPFPRVFFQLLLKGSCGFVPLTQVKWLNGFPNMISILEQQVQYGLIQFMCARATPTNYIDSAYGPSFPIREFCAHFSTSFVCICGGGDKIVYVILGFPILILDTCRLNVFQKLIMCLDIFTNFENLY